MTARPLIGVSTSELRPAEGAHFANHSEPPRRMLALGVSYLDAVAAAGGIPVILAPLPAGRLEAILHPPDGPARVDHRPPRRCLPIRRARCRAGLLRLAAASRARADGAGGRSVRA